MLVQVRVLSWALGRLKYFIIFEVSSSYEKSTKNKIAGYADKVQHWICNPE